jgi:3D (Asp-Asp-Asp) domain-containing protein
MEVVDYYISGTKKFIMRHILLISALLFLFNIGKAQMSLNQLNINDDPVVLYEFDDFLKDVDDVTEMELVLGENNVEYSTVAAGTIFGQASYYANKFTGRPTASGELYYHNKFTAACNVLPLGTTVKVTNLSNKKSVVVKINDRLSKKVNRIVDLSWLAATKLDYIQKGLTRVKVEIL